MRERLWSAASLTSAVIGVSLCWGVAMAAHASGNSAATPAWQSPLSVSAGKVAPPTDGGTYSRGLAVNENDITPDQATATIALTPAELHQAAVWALTPEEEQRYVFLLQNKSGTFYAGKHLSPVWILGLNARSDAERHRFAVLAAQQEQQYIAQNLAWNSAMQAAYSQRTAGLPVVKPFDVAPFSPATHEAVVWQAHDSVNLFLTPTEAVGEVMSNILAAQMKNPTLTLNLFFLGADDEAIQTFAQQQSLPLDWVRAGRITLNHGERAYQSIALPNKKTPLLLLDRQGVSMPIDIGVL